MVGQCSGLSRKILARLQKRRRFAAAVAASAVFAPGFAVALYSRQGANHADPSEMVST